MTVSASIVLVIFGVALLVAYCVLHRLSNTLFDLTARADGWSKKIDALSSLAAIDDRLTLDTLAKEQARLASTRNNLSERCQRNFEDFTTLAKKVGEMETYMESHMEPLHVQQKAKRKVPKVRK